MAAPIERTPDDVRAATAYHEAGHAVANLAQGLPIRKVSIIPEEEYHGVCFSPGEYCYEYKSPSDKRQIGRKIIIGFYAGAHAQRLVDGTGDTGDGKDQEDAFEVSRQFNVLPRGCRQIGDEVHRKYLERLRIESRRLVKRHKLAIAALAKELLRQKELDMAAVETIVKSEAIKEAFKALPNATAKEIVAHLKAKGVEVTEGLVYQVKKISKKKPGRKPGKAAEQGQHMPLGVQHDTTSP